MLALAQGRTAKRPRAGAALVPADQGDVAITLEEGITYPAQVGVAVGSQRHVEIAIADAGHAHGFLVSRSVANEADATALYKETQPGPPRRSSRENGMDSD